MDERMARLWAGRGLCFAGLAGPVKHTDEQLSSRVRFIGHTGRMTRPVGRGRWFILEGAGAGRLSSGVSYISTLLTCQQRLWQDSRLALGGPT